MKRATTAAILLGLVATQGCSSQEDSSQVASEMDSDTSSLEAGAELAADTSVTVPRTLTRDVLVFGGTPAGIMAAVDAKRLGKSVVVLEPSHWWGGMTAGGLSVTDSGTSGVISGLTREYFRRTNELELANGAAPKGKFVVEPHVARSVFKSMLNEIGLVVKTDVNVLKVNKSGTTIKSVEMNDGAVYYAKQFIDASYEGDLMAAAGVSYTWGRESSSQYGEPEAGVRPPVAPLGGALDPYRIAKNPQSGLLPFVSSAPLAPLGSADKHIMAYNYRICATDIATHGANAVPYSQLKPARYDRTKFAGAQRVIDFLTSGGSYNAQSVANWFFLPSTNRTTGELSPYANGKFDINGLGIYTSDVVGIVDSYPDGNGAARDVVRQTVADYDMGLLYYLTTDASVPADVRAYMAKFGACRDEFVDNNYFPYQLYVREGRRMIGEYVMTESNILLEHTVPDVVAMGGYGMDSHIRQYLAIDGQLMFEGGGIDRSPYTRVGIEPGTPYGISYRALTPRRSEVTNLLNPVTLSASSMAYRSLRMEPQYMMMGAAAGAAASIAIDRNSAVQDVRYSDLRTELLKQGQIMVVPGDCFDKELYVPNGKSIKAYLHATSGGSVCRSEIRICTDGVLSGSYGYRSCTVTP